MQKKHVLTATLIIVIGLAWAGTASAGPLKKRFKNQQFRINDGIASGEITGREARHLRRQQRQIRKLRHHFWADGRLTQRERRILSKRLNRNSERIYAYKHNRRFYRH